MLRVASLTYHTLRYMSRIICIFNKIFITLTMPKAAVYTSSTALRRFPSSDHENHYPPRRLTAG